jgi:prolyl 4-hydroxylase
MNFIGEYQISEEAVDELINYWNVNKANAEEGRVGNGKLDEKVKKSLEIMIDPEDLTNLLYKNELLKCLKQYTSKYKFADNVEFYGINHRPKIQYYDKGWGFYKWHIENDGNPSVINRHLVFSTYLNDVENGGTQFLYQDYVTKARKGSTIIFPAGWTHAHKGQISENQEKYIITGWFNFLET